MRSEEGTQTNLISITTSTLACSALHRAAAAGGGRNRFDAARLKEGAQLQEEGAADAARPTGAVIALLARDDGAIVDAVDHAGYTALHVAAAAADSAAVRALCAAGARYDFQAVNDEDSGAQGFHPRFPSSSQLAISRD
jgi:ankyrin repeat protein